MKQNGGTKYKPHYIYKYFFKSVGIFLNPVMDKNLEYLKEETRKFNAGIYKNVNKTEQVHEVVIKIKNNLFDDKHFLFIIHNYKIPLTL